MNKKGAGLLIIASVGFLLAIIIFYTYGSKQLPGGEVSYLGESEVNAFAAYTDGEKQLLYIDIAAEKSIREALKEASEGNAAEKLNNIAMDNFKAKFGTRLKNFNKAYNANITIEDYEFTLGKESLKGICVKEINITSERIDYRFSPSFRIKL